MKTNFAAAFLSVAGLLALANSSPATIVGTDDATSYVSLGGWTDGSNGSTSGDAFQPWIFSNNGQNYTGMFLGNSTMLSSGSGGDINTDGMSMGIYGSEGGFNEALRYLNGSLAVGQTFSLDLAVNWRNGNKGIDIRDDSANRIFNFNIGSDMYVVSDATTGGGNLYADLPDNGYSTNTTFTLSFTQVDESGGSWSITRGGGIVALNTGTYAGVIDSFKLYVATQFGTQNDDFFLNNMVVADAIPEPATLALLFGAGLTTLIYRRRR